MSHDAVARALVLEAPRHLVVRELAVPVVGDDEGFVRVAPCGLCGTGHEQYTGELAGGFTFVPGHETVGTIEAIGHRPLGGTAVGVAEGGRVAVEVFQSCRQCERCLRGEYLRCVRHGLADMYGFIPVDRYPELWSGYAEYQYLAPDSMVLPVPDSLDPVVATLFNPLGAGIRWGVTVPGTKAGDVVTVLGPGISGVVRRRRGKRGRCRVRDGDGAGRRDADPLALASKFGADLAVDVAIDDPVAALSKATDTLADVVVDVTARAPAAFAQAIALAHPAGTVVSPAPGGSAVALPGFSPRPGGIQGATRRRCSRRRCHCLSRRA